jgi:phospholipase/carboxylesterase
MGMGGGRDGLLRVPPEGLAAPLPLLVMLHGYGSGAERALKRIAPIADEVLLVLPDSRGATWDVLEGGYGPDIAAIDAVLGRVLADWPVDPARLAIGGFSDGASYALSLGLMNGGLFSHAFGFSPGFVAPLRFEGRARVFVSHGTADKVLPIEHCSRALMPKLQRAGYQGKYYEFEGGHELPAEIARLALDFLNAPEAASIP